MPDRYGTEFRKLRDWWAPRVAAGGVLCHEPVCLEPSREIRPGAAWDLAHDESGSLILGPAHAHCNRTEGSARGNATRWRNPAPVPAWRPSRSW